MLKSTIYIFLVTVSVQLFGQGITISDPIELDLDYYYNLLGKENEKYYFLKGGDLDYKIYGFDNDLKKLWTTTFKMEKRRPKFIDAQLYNKKINILYHADTKKNVAELKLTKHDLTGNIKDTIDLGVVYEKLTVRSDLKVVSSENKRFKLIWNQDFNGIVKFWIVDLEKDTLLANNKFDLGKPIGQSQFHKFMVSNKGLAYMILDVNNFSKKIDEHAYRLFKLNKEEDIYRRSYEVSMKGNLTVSADFTYDNLNDQIVGGGLYGNENVEKTTGVFYIRLPLNRNLKKVTEFNVVDFEEYIYSNKKRQKDQFLDVRVQDLVLGANGELIIICEQVKLRVYTDQVVRTSEIKTDFYFNNLFLISQNRQGEIFWINTLKKNQTSQNDLGIYSSFFLYKDPKAFRLIFNDYINKNGTVSEYIIRGDGKYDRDIVFNTDKKELGLRIRDSEQISRNEFIIPSESKKTVKLVSVIF
jgi:hypothetical protein